MTSRSTRHPVGIQRFKHKFITILLSSLVLIYDVYGSLFYSIGFFWFLPKPIAWTLPQVVGSNPFPTYYQEPRASFTAWWCIFETKSSHVAKISHGAKVSH